MIYLLLREMCLVNLESVDRIIYSIFRIQPGMENPYPLLT